MSAASPRAFRSNGAASSESLNEAGTILTEARTDTQSRQAERRAGIPTCLRLPKVRVQHADANLQTSAAGCAGYELYFGAAFIVTRTSVACSVLPSALKDTDTWSPLPIRSVMATFPPALLAAVPAPFPTTLVSGLMT